MNEVDKYILDVITKALDQEVLVEFSDLKKCDLVITQYNNLFDYMEKYVFSMEKLRIREKYAYNQWMILLNMTYLLN